MECSTAGSDMSQLSESWKPLLPNHFILDDVRFDSISNRYSTGIVIRDDKGGVCDANDCSIRNPGTVVGAELMAIRCGMNFCLHLGLTNVCIFLDCLAAVCAMNHSTDEIGHVGALALEIRSMLGFSTFISIKHMRRTTNNVAHLIARKALCFTLNIE